MIGFVLFKALFCILLLPNLMLCKMPVRTPHIMHNLDKDVNIIRIVSSATETSTSDTTVERNYDHVPKTKKRRMRFSSKKPVQQSKTIKTMDYEEIKELKKQYLEKGNNTSHLLCIEQMMRLSTDIEQKSMLLLEWADLLYEMKHYEQAAVKYREFDLLYPGDKAVQRTKYQTINALFNTILSADRDQSRTKEVISLADQFLEKESFTQYRSQVKHIRNQCQQRLLDSYLVICDFHIKREKYYAAQVWLKELRSDILPHATELEYKVLERELLVAKGQNNSDLVEEKQLLLAALEMPKEDDLLPSKEDTFRAAERF